MIFLKAACLLLTVQYLRQSDKRSRQTPHRKLHPHSRGPRGRGRGPGRGGSAQHRGADPQPTYQQSSPSHSLDAQTHACKVKGWKGGEGERGPGAHTCLEGDGSAPPTLSWPCCTAVLTHPVAPLSTAALSSRGRLPPRGTN